MADEKSELQRLQDGVAQIDAFTTQLATAATSITTRIQGLMDEIKASDNLAQISNLADSVNAEVAKFAPITDALTALGSNPQQPVPVTPVV